jgi:phage host-nuclease inhibitor protein Gam
MSQEHDTTTGAAGQTSAVNKTFENLETGILEQLGPNKRAAYESLVDAGYVPTEALQLVEEHCADEPEPFRIHDMSSANWVLKKIAECDETEAEVIRMLNDEIKAITERTQQILRPIIRRREFFQMTYGPEIESFARGKLDGQKTKSLNLINGKIGFRKNPNKVVIDDESMAIEHLELLCPDAIKKSVLLTPLEKYMEANSYTSIESVAHIEEGEETFYIKASLPGAEA